MKIQCDLQGIFVWQLFSVFDDAVSHPETLWRTTGFMAAFAFNARGDWWFSDTELVFIQKICVSLNENKANVLSG